MDGNGTRVWTATSDPPSGDQILALKLENVRDTVDALPSSSSPHSLLHFVSITNDLLGCRE